MSLFRGRVPIVAALVVLVAAGLFVYADTDDGGDPADSRPGATSAPGDFRTTDEILADTLAAVAEHPSYAGVYNDSVLGIVIRATDNLDWFESATADLAARNRRVRIESAEYTMAQLEAAMAEIDVMVWREERGVPVTLVGVNAQKNRVQIGVQDLTPAHEAALRESYGGIVVIVEQPGFEARPGGS